MLFDSSTAGLEALQVGAIPVFIGHECNVHVNPNEFDRIITKYIYNEDELLKLLNSKIKINLSEANIISDKYFGSDDDYIGNIINRTLQ